jgi:HK97 family phage major capsid protein
MRQVPFRTRIARELAGNAGASWIGEGKAKPAVELAFDNVVVDPYKAAVITVITSELAKFSTPSAEAVIRSSLVAGVAAFIDAQFLNPSITLIANQRPASITNGAPSVTSTGNTAAAIAADLAAMEALLGSWTAPTYVMKPSTAAAIAGKGVEFAGITAAGGLLHGIPVVASTNSPAQITLLDAMDVLLADDGDADLSFADQASLEMSTTPGTPGSPVAGGEMVSLWQANYAGFLAERWISWLRAHSNSAVYMAVSY